QRAGWEDAPGERGQALRQFCRLAEEREHDVGGPVARGRPAVRQVGPRPPGRRLVERQARTGLDPELLRERRLGIPGHGARFYVAARDNRGSQTDVEAERPEGEGMIRRYAAAALAASTLFAAWPAQAAAKGVPTSV